MRGKARWGCIFIGLVWLGCGSGEEKIAGKTTEQWLRALGSEDAAVREKMAHQLGMAGPKAIPVVSQALKSDNPYVNIGGVIALWVIGVPAVPELAKAVDHPNPEVRCKAIEALGHIGVNADSAVPALVRRVNDIEPRVQKYAMEALPKMGIRAKFAVDALIGVLRDASDPELRVCAAKALGEIGPDAAAALPVLKALAKEPEPLRTAAQTAIKQIQ